MSYILNDEDLERLTGHRQRSKHPFRPDHGPEGSALTIAPAEKRTGGVPIAQSVNASRTSEPGTRAKSEWSKSGRTATSDTETVTHEPSYGPPGHRPNQSAGENTPQHQ